MGAHEQLEKVLTWSPVAKIAAAVIFLAVIAGIVYGLLAIGDSLATARYNKQREALEAEIAKRKHNEAQLAGENSLLKKQNEATAEMLAGADSRRETDAARKFNNLANERAKRYEEIDLENDYSAQLCGLCADAQRSGYRLSDSICGRCKGVSQDDR